MSVTLSSAGVILLRDDCPLEDAETLARLLSDDPAAEVDWSGCEQLHTAVIQVLAVAKPRMVGLPTNPFLRRYLTALV